jgi:hypothetical protein
MEVVAGACGIGGCNLRALALASSPTSNAVSAKRIALSGTPLKSQPISAFVHPNAATQVVPHSIQRKLVRPGKSGR